MVDKALFRNFRGLTPITSAHEVRNLLDKVDIIIRGIKKLMSVKLMTPFQLLLLIMFHVSSTPVGSKNKEATESKVKAKSLVATEVQLRNPSLKERAL